MGLQRSAERLIVVRPADKDNTTVWMDKDIYESEKKETVPSVAAQSNHDYAQHPWTVSSSRSEMSGASLFMTLLSSENVAHSFKKLND